ncbi:MAG: LytTR family DNA-binding domain-containing protein [Oscillospiraceae bacterium]
MGKIIKIAFCDDDIAFSDKAKSKVETVCKQKEIDVEIKLFDSAAAFLENDLSFFDVIFLDIEMDINGIEVGAEIAKRKINPIIIFVSSYIEYAPKGYQVSAFRYILKDNFDFLITSCIDDVVTKMDERKRTIKVKTGMVTESILLEDILYIESRKRLLCIHFVNDKRPELSYYNKICDLENEIGFKGFLRIHKSFLVNVQYIESIARTGVKLTNGEVLSVSQANYNEVYKSFVFYSV